MNSSRGGKRRVLFRTGWAFFEVLYAARGSPVSTGFLVEATGASGLREHIRRLRRAVVGSRYHILPSAQRGATVKPYPIPRYVSPGRHDSTAGEEGHRGGIAFH